MLLAAAQRLLPLAALTDVAHHGQDLRRCTAGGVGDDPTAELHPPVLAVRAAHTKADCRRSGGRERGRKSRTDVADLVGMDEVEHVAADQIGRFVAEPPDGRRHVAQRAVGCAPRNDIGDVLGQRAVALRAGGQLIAALLDSVTIVFELIGHRQGDHEREQHLQHHRRLPGDGVQAPADGVAAPRGGGGRHCDQAELWPQAPGQHSGCADGDQDDCKRQCGDIIVDHRGARGLEARCAGDDQRDQHGPPRILRLPQRARGERALQHQVEHQHVHRVDGQTFARHQLDGEYSVDDDDQPQRHPQALDQQRGRGVEGKVGGVGR